MAPCNIKYRVYEIVFISMYQTVNDHVIVMGRQVRDEGLENQCFSASL